MRKKNELLVKGEDHRQVKLVEESSSRETSLATKVADLQVDLKHAKKADRQLRQENESYRKQLAALQKEFEKAVEKKDQLTHENEAMKAKEAQILEEYNQLEEENTCLQKAVSKLKQTLVEFEGLKVENKSLISEVDSLQLQLQMTSDGREQYEKQLKDSFEAIRELRERNTQLQKHINELEHRETLKSWELEQAELKFAESEEHPIVKQITDEYNTSRPAPAAGLVDDLMKELHFTELRDLEDQLRIVQEEKQSLQKQLNARDSQISQLQRYPDGILADSRRRGESDPESKDAFSTNNQLKVHCLIV